MAHIWAQNGRMTPSSSLRGANDSGPAGSKENPDGLDLDHLDQVIADAIGEAVRLERLKARLSQKKLADLAHVDIKTIGRVERADTGVTQKTIYRIAYALGLDPSDLTVKANAALRSAIEAREAGV